MAQPLIKFFRVASLPPTGTPGALYFVSGEGVLYVCTSEASFEAYAGIKAAALDGSVLTLTPSVGGAISVDIAALAQAAVDLSEYAKTEAVNTAIANAIAAEVERANGAYDEKGAANAVKTAVIGDATTAGDTLGKLEDRIEAIVTNEKTYSVVKMTEAEVSALGNSNVKEAYKLIDEDKAAVGDPILVYKDSSLKSAAMGTDGNAQKLMLTYILADGSESVVPVDLSAFYAESETGDGLQLINHVISVKKDATSEAFLTVGADGVKLSGVQAAIDTAKSEAIAAITPAIQALDAEVTSTDGAKVTVKVTEVDGKITAVNVTESDIASAQSLSDLATVVNENEQVTSAALNDLNGRLKEAEGKLESGVGVMSVTKGTEEGDLVTTVIGGTEADPTVAVSATDALKTAVTAAGSAVQTVTGDAYVTATKAGTTVTLATQVEDGVVENSTKLVTSGDVYNALCWQDGSF